jgi:hypothetical protein
VSEEERRSFLKKRTKKLLSVAGSIPAAWLNSWPDAKCNLLAFFRKEDLSFRFVKAH